MSFYWSTSIFLLVFIHALSHRLRLQTAKYNRPASFKVGIGEDAWLISSLDVGVFDGVGDWAKTGIDSGLFSRKMSRYSSSLMEVERLSGVNKLNLPRILQFAVDECKRERTFGSSTACLASLDPSNRALQICNLGDSGIILMRPRTFYSNVFETVYASAPQYHSWNTPFQLGHYDHSTGSPTSSTYKFDHPKQATIAYHPIQQGDLLIVASDGLFDNLFVAEIEQLASTHLLQNLRYSTNESSPVDYGHLSTFITILGQEAVDVACGKVLRPTPWTLQMEEQMKNQQRNNWMNRLRSALGAPIASAVAQSTAGRHCQGKDDDITIIGALVCEDNVN